MPQRVMPLPDVFNFRDLGGYAAADGQTVAWGRLFRSDDLSRLTEAGQKVFVELGIRTVVDLRRPEEVAEDGRIPEFDGYAYQHIFLPHPHWPHAEFADTSARARYLADRYAELADHAAVGLGEALRTIAEAGNAPLVMHCIAGKDRTGTLSALTLSLLGVADDDVAEDFALSEAAEPLYREYLRRTDPEAAAKRWQHIIVSPREAMVLFLAELRKRHGSVPEYAASIGVTADHVAAMRAHLLA